MSAVHRGRAGRLPRDRLGPPFSQPGTSHVRFDSPEDRRPRSPFPGARRPAGCRGPPGNRPLHPGLRRKRPGGTPDRRRRQRLHRLRRGNRDPECRPRQPGGRPGRLGAALADDAHLLLGRPVRGLRGPGRDLEPDHAGHAREEDDARQQRRRGPRERREDRPARDRTRCGRRLRARLPRAHAPDDEHDLQGPALQVRLRALRRRDLPDALPLRIPRPLPRPGRRRGRARGVLQDPGGRREGRLRRRRARARRGRLHRRAARLGEPRSPGSAASTASCSSSTRSRPGSDGPGGCSRPSTTTSSPTS